MSNTTEKPVQLTPSAVKEVKRLLEKQSRPEAVLRIGVKNGGCSGMEYAMGFETKISPHDQVFEEDGLRIVVDAKSALFLRGTTLNFVDGLEESGFKFINPNAKQTCGCGTSFSA